MSPRPRSPAVFVFAQRGCPACEDYLPRFKQRANGAPYPIGVYHLGDGGRGDEMANQLGIKATPTTTVMTRDGRLRNHVGALADNIIERVLKSVLG